MKKNFSLAGILMGIIIASSTCITASGTESKAKSDSQNASGKSFTVLSMTPEGELPSQVEYPSIQIQFSEPVVALKELGEQESSSYVFSIEPPLKGVFRWKGTSVLSFDSTDKTVPQKQYTLRINPNLVSKKGNKISGKLEYTFHTEELKLNSIQPAYAAYKEGRYVDNSSVPPELAKDIALHFNLPVNAAVVSKTITVTDNKNTTYKFSALNDGEKTLVLHLKETPAEDRQITVTLQKDSIADKDCYPTSANRSRSFHTLIPFVIKDCSENIRWLSRQYDKPVRLTFSSILKEESEAELAQFITAEGKKEKATVTKENLLVQGQTLLIFGLPFDYNETYTLKVSSSLKDIYGRKLDKDYSFTIKVPDAESFVSFKNSGLQTLESQFTPRIVFTHQNIKSPSSYRIEPLTNADGSKSTQRGKTISLDVLKIPQNKRITESVDLRDYLQKVGNQYRGAVLFKATVNVERKWQDWKTKKYRTELDDYTNEQIIQVTDLGLTVRYAYNRAVVMVTSLSTGKSVPNATVNVKIVPYSDAYERNGGYANVLTKNYATFASATTDSEGVAIIEFKNDLVAALQSSVGGKRLDYNTNLIYIEAKTLDDRVMFCPSQNGFWWSSGNVDKGDLEGFARERMVATIFTDRGLYKPGETVSYKLIDRTLYKEEYSVPRGKDAEYTITLVDQSWNSNKSFYKTSGTLSANGTTSGSFKLPEDLKPGDYYIRYQRNLSGALSEENCRVQVQFFEKLRFEAEASVPQGTYYRGDTLSAELSASYLGGGALDNSTYSSTWTRQKQSFSAHTPAYKSYTYGPKKSASDSYLRESGNGTLSAEGKATINHNTGTEKGTVAPATPYLYTMEARVTDSGNQAISTSTSVLVHPAKFYIGLSNAKNIKGFAKKGDTLKFDYVCITPEEKAAAQSLLPKDGKIKLELLREEWKRTQSLSSDGYISYNWKREDILEDERSLAITDGNEFSLVPEKGGSYTLRLSTKDANGSDVITERNFYVTSSDWYWHTENQQQIGLTPDKAEYSVNDSAQIMVQSELPRGKYLMTVERGTILSQKILNITEPTSVISVPILDSYAPVIYVSLSSYSTRQNGNTGATEEKRDTDKPKGYFGVTALNVDLKTKTFDIQIKMDKPSYRAGDKAQITLHASRNGQPLANAELALIAADRGVLDLIGYHIQDPSEVFYSKYLFPDRAYGGDSRQLLIDHAEESDDAVEDECVEELMMCESAAAPRMVMKSAKNTARMLEGSAMADASAMGAKEKAAPALKVRKNFASTAVFRPDLVTDANGDVTVTFTLPDSLTTYRVTAVGIKDNLFARAEEELDVAEPISVRQVLPRKLRLDDKGEAGVTITNLDAQNHDVTVAMNVYSGVEKAGIEQDASAVQKLPGKASVQGENKKTVSVKGQSTQALMFSIKAEQQGWITVEYSVTGDLINEKIFVPLEIEKPYIFEAVTTIGEVRDAAGIKEGKASAKETIILPGDAEDGRGSLYVQLDPTRLGVLREAVGYVFHYPYGCMEQRSAAVLPLVAFGDYIKIFDLNTEVKDPASVAANEIRSWAKVQNSDGGFPYWPNGFYRESNRYVSMRIAEILSLAKQRGIVKNSGINEEKLASYLIRESDSIIKEKDEASWAMYTAAYGYYAAQMLGGKIDEANLERISDSDSSDVETLALAALTYLNMNQKAKAKAVSQKMYRFVRLTARGIDITGKAKDHYWCFFNHSSEKYAFYLQLFTRMETTNTINQRLVYELLKMQKTGRWQSTAVTSRVLIAIYDYIKTNDLDNLDFTAEVLLNGKNLASGKFYGVASLAEDKEIDFAQEPLASMPKDKELELEFKKDGRGTLFYTASMKYAIPPVKQTARDEGLCVYTEITDAETGEVISESKLESGKIYREKVVISSVIDAEYVALRAPVPAGCEILNSAFVTTGTIPSASSQEESPVRPLAKNRVRPWWYNPNRGLSYKGIYDVEMQYFWDYFPRGIQEVEFTFRASRKGMYNTPCVTAECMYEEEIFGRSSGRVWEIK